jgi:UDP-N-acetylglucosamine:LPS N-acetylglucosamine transferase
VKALLLSGSIGMGHDVMAEACAVSLRERGWQTDTLDSMRLMGPSASGLGERVFRGLLAVPGAYDAFHFEQLRTGGRLARAAERAAAKYAVPALRAELGDHPADLVVSVFATGAAATARIKAEHPGMRTAVFCTDVCPHRLWVHESTDLYLVTSQAAAGFIRCFHPESEIANVPAPARPQFYKAPTRQDARIALDVPEDASCVLLMGGSWGMGPLLELADELGRAGIYTLAVAGNNRSMADALHRLHERRPRVVPFGFTDRVPELMAASDVVITTSGDTCSEARVIGRELLLLDVVPGHGRENLEHELERGGAAAAPADPAGLRRAVVAALARVSPPTERVVQTPDAWEQAFGAALTRIGFGSAAAQ